MAMTEQKLLPAAQLLFVEDMEQKLASFLSRVVLHSEMCLSPGKAGSHLIEALVQAQVGHLHHVAHRPVVFCHGHFRLAVP